MSEAQETVVLTNLTPSANLMRPRAENLCTARCKNCSACEHRYAKEEYELWQCPECGNDRHCGSKKVTGYNVCRMHGGGSPARGKVSGRPRKSKYADVLPGDLATDYKQGVADPELLALRDEIALSDARKKQLLARIKACGSDDVKEIDALWRQVDRCTEQGRKLRATETDMMVKLQQYITKERAIAFTRAVASSVQESLGLIPDDKLRLQVRNAFEVRLSRIMQTKRSDLVDLLVEPLE